jgi:hypothetical protein
MGVVRRCGRDLRNSVPDSGRLFALGLSRPVPSCVRPVCLSVCCSRARAVLRPLASAALRPATCLASTVVRAVPAVPAFQRRHAHFDGQSSQQPQGRGELQR